jgi:hypothetical protein
VTGREEGIQPVAQAGVRFRVQVAVAVQREAVSGPGHRRSWSHTTMPIMCILMSFFEPGPVRRGQAADGEPAS